MNILITGGNGFVGTNITQYFLNLGCSIDVLDITSSTIEGVGNSYYWDKISAIDFDKYDAIIHLAGKAHDTRGVDQREVYFAVNTELTKLIFDRFQQSTTTVFINFSSVKAVADKVENETLTEDYIPMPIGPYAESKLKAEKYILENQNNTPDKKIYILRPCMIHGPGNKGNLNLLYSVVNKGVPYPLGAFNNSRSFTSIDNLSYLLSKLIEGLAPSGVYNIADDQAISTNTLVAIISDVLGRKTRIWTINQTIIKFFAKLGDITRFPFNTFRLDKLTENYVVSNQKIKQALGVDKLPLTVVQGIEITIKSFKKNV